MSDYIANERDVEWLTSSALPGIAAKLLTGDPDTKTHTVLARWDPGSGLPRHAHPSLEQMYILEGECESEGEVYGPGTLIISPAESEHGPYKVGDEGMLTLVSFSGRSGFEDVPEYKERYRSVGLL